MNDFSVRTILRVVLVVVGVVLALYLIYLLRKPLGWLFLAAFLAVAISGPVNTLDRHMRRGFAIALVYFGLFLVPVMLGALVIPPLVEEGNNLADNLPRYAQDVREFVDDNKKLRELDQDYDITSRIEEEAGKLPGQLGGAAGTLGDVGLALVNSIFALITILILSAFMLSGGRGWIDRALATQSPDRGMRMRRALERMRGAVANYVGGALAQALIAAVLSYIVLSILGVPFRAPLAVLIGLLDLIPLIGATIGAVVVGIFTLFSDFPTATIVWVIWSIIYQQIENTVIQPQIQRRAVDLNPFLVLVAVLFGATLLGIIGALVAIPLAASIQIAVREYLLYRAEVRGDGPLMPPADDPGPADDPPPPFDGPEPAPAS